ncbi:MAG: transporter substrate-binding domain-containing protein [bacterium]|nr:transporter substrate-binding domain-containing protein [bacterium]
MAIKTAGDMAGHNDAVYSGYAVELSERFARYLGCSGVVVKVIKVTELLDVFSRSDSLMAIGSITPTLERAEKMDFGLSYLGSDVSVLVKVETPGLKRYVVRMFTEGPAGKVFPYFITLVLVFSVLIYLAELRSDIFSNKLFQGMQDSAWFCFVTSTTVGYGDKVPTNVISRILTICLMFTGIGFMSVLISSSVAALEPESCISAIGDLRGKMVATKAATASVGVVRQFSDNIHLTTELEEAIAMLDRGEVDAVVHDKPALNYYSKVTGGEYAILSQPLVRQVYTPVFPRGSELRQKWDEFYLSINPGEIRDLRMRYLSESVI